MRKYWLILILLLVLSGAGCDGAAALTPTPDPQFAAQGVGEPRGSGYWLLWNSCAPDNRSETAATNGGRAAGWIIMDDLLADPGILLGEYAVTTCEAGVRLLQGEAETGDDAAYPLAVQLLAAQLNLAAGAEHCPAVDESVQGAQLLLLRHGFTGTGTTLPTGTNEEARKQAQALMEQLQIYNSGNLCR